MREFGLLGFPLGHSFSKKYFSDKFEKLKIDATYLNFEFESANDILSIIATHPNLEGFNVTIPHKQAIIPLLNKVTPEAEQIGAVNCVKIERNETGLNLIGHNTDVIGFEGALRNFLGENEPKKALVLGNGGAAKAVRYVLTKMGILFLTVSRNPQKDNEISYNKIPSIIGEYKLIVNTTPLGTWPNVDSCPNLPYDMLTTDHFLFDLVYNPQITKFMSQGEKIGTNVCNGHEMLVLQAEAGWKIWNEK